MTTGAAAVLLDLFGLALWVAVMAGVWSALRKKRYILGVPGLLIGAAGLVLVARGGEKLLMLAHLRALRADEVRRCDFGGTMVEDREALGALFRALNAATWATAEHSCQARAIPVRLELKAGVVRELWLASSPCAAGVVVNLSDISGSFYHGALFSPTPAIALAAHGLALPSE